MIKPSGRARLCLYSKKLPHNLSRATLSTYHVKRPPAMLHSVNQYLRGMRGRIVFLGSIVAFVYLLSRSSEHLENQRSSAAMAPVDQWRTQPQVMEGLRNFWKDLSHDLAVTKPSNPVPKHGPPDEKLRKVTQGAGDLYSLKLSTKDIEAMRSAHAEFISRTSALSLVDLYVPGSKGIVTTAGGKYIPILLVSLRLLRRTGSTLPVEVFLADDSEYDARLCTRTLPSLNARCRVLTDVLGASASLEIKSYQYKIFSILFSSFEDVFFLDADNLPLIDPAPLLESDPYATNGLILWPDFWPSTISDIFFEIRGKPKQNVTGSDRTSETGQLIISKRKHLESLILSTYYNFYGPGYYYSLLSQGAPGEGDKETFHIAAEYFGKPYYRVQHSVSALGYFEEGNFRGTAMLQSDPRNDFKKEKPEPAFIHANFPKFDPFTYLDKGVTKFKKTGKPHRVWQDIHQKGYKLAWGDDPERIIFEEMITVACSFGPMYPGASKAACGDLRRHYRAVFGTSR